MNRWFRVYSELIDDPKFIKLGPDLRSALLMTWCVAGANDGQLPALEDVAIKFRLSEARTQKLLGELERSGFIDRDDEETLRPHNWDVRQFKTDTTDPTAAERNRRYRKKQRNERDDTDRNDRNGAVSLTDTRTDTEADTEADTDQKQNSDATASGALAPIDHRKRLFNEGLAKIAAMTGKGPDACRSFVGKCLKAADDNAVTVLGLIEDAERNQVVNPTAWIAARLKPQENSNGRRTIHDANNELLEKLRALDEPAPSGICGGESESVIRLLPSR